MSLCFSSENKKTIFLVNSVPLVTQQKEYLQQNLDLVVNSFCGADGVDFWNKSQWDDIIEKSQVQWGSEYRTIK